MSKLSKMMAQTAHRPWPQPNKTWIMRQQWLDLLFAHWPVSVSDLRPHIPEILEIDTFEGQAWIGIVPFRMKGIRPRFLPAVPWLSAFEELNVRTYVTVKGKPGVWFFSLDAANPVAVKTARKLFYLPYFDARMTLQQEGNYIRYRSHRIHKDAHPAELKMLYRPKGSIYQAEPGSLEHWLTERYCLYAANSKGHVFRGEIHHQPWPLQSAEAEFQLNTLTHGLNIDTSGPPAHLHFARFLDVVVWPIEKI